MATHDRMRDARYSRKLNSHARSDTWNLRMPNFPMFRNRLALAKAMVNTPATCTSHTRVSTTSMMTDCNANNVPPALFQR